MSDSQLALVASLPSCALLCVISAVQNNSTCGLTDFDCSCGVAAVTAAAETCVNAACTIREALVAKNTTEHLCGRGPDQLDIMPPMATFMALAALAVILRIAARVFMKLKIWWDDVANVGAFLSCAAHFGVYVWLVSIGSGTDIWFLTPDEITDNLIGMYMILIFYGTSRFLVRISVALFYLRLFAVAGHSHARLIIWGSIAFCCVFTATVLSACLFQCMPVSYFWLRWDNLHDGRCINTYALGMVTATIAIAFDIWFIYIPIHYVRKSQMQTRDKVQASVMFAIGLAVIIISIVRLPTLNALTGASQRNITRTAIPLNIFSFVETTVSVICASLPSVRIYVQPLITRIWGSALHYGSGYGRSSKANKSKANNAQRSGLDTGNTTGASKQRDGPADSSHDRDTKHAAAASNTELVPVSTGDSDDYDSYLRQNYHQQNFKMTSARSCRERTETPSRGSDVSRPATGHESKAELCGSYGNVK